MAKTDSERIRFIQKTMWETMTKETAKKFLTLLNAKLDAEQSKTLETMSKAETQSILIIILTELLYRAYAQEEKI